MRKKAYIVPQIGIQHISYSTALLDASPQSFNETDWDPDGNTPTEIIEEKPGDLPTQVTGAKEWNAWGWDD